MFPHLLTAASLIAGFAAISGHKRIRLPGTQAAKLPFSDAVWAGDTLYLSGHIGLDPQTGRPPASAGDEAKLVMEGIKQTLKAAGLTTADLVSIQVFCSDVDLFHEFNAVYVTYFNGEYPARAFLGSGRLLFDARFEVLGIAVRS